MALVIIQAIALLFILLVSRRVIQHFQRRSAARAAGCLPPTRYPQSPFRFGADFAKLQLQKQTQESYKEFLRDLFDQYGRTFSVSMMGQPWLFTCNLENIRAVNTSLASSFVVEPFRKLTISDWLGDGMFVSDGEKWKASRALFKPMFDRGAVSQLDGFEKHLDRLMGLIPEDGVAFDLQPLLKRFYLDVSTEVLLGRSANSQSPGNELFDIESFESNFATAMAGMFTRIFSRLATIVASDNKLWRQACKNVHQIFDQQIERSFSEKLETTSENKVPQSMVDELSALSQDGNFIRDQLLNVFIGAKDTAGIGISDIFFHLVRHPDVWQKIRSEVLQVDINMPITFELLKSFKYLHSVIAESLRLLSPVTMSIRSAARDCILPTGGGPDRASPIFVTKGTKVEISISSLHLDTGVWGPDAAEFRPDRWSDGLLVKWEYVPFLGGARMCPAQQMMLTQYALVLVRFAQRFERLENRDDVREFVPRIVFSQESANGVRMAVRRVQ